MALPVLPNNKQTGVDPNIAAAGSSFMQETNTILRAQVDILSKILSTVDSLAASVKKGFDSIEARFADQEQNNQRRQSLNQLSSAEDDAEKKPNAFRRLTESFKNSAVGGGILTVLKALLIPYLIGFATSIGKATNALGLLEKGLTFVFKAIDKVFGWLGDLVSDLTGSKKVGALVKELPKFLAPLAALRFVSKDLFNFIMKPLQWLTSMVKKLPVFGEGGGFIRMAGKFFAFLNVVFTALDTIKGAIKGFEQGGALGAITGGARAYLESFIGNIGNVIVHLLGSVLNFLGADKIGGFLKQLNVKKLVDIALDKGELLVSQMIEKVVDFFKHFSFSKLLSKSLENMADVIKGVFGFDPRDIIKKVIDLIPKSIQKYIPDSVFEAAGISPPGDGRDKIGGEDAVERRKYALANGGTDFEKGLSASQQKMLVDYQNAIAKSGSHGAASPQNRMNIVKMLAKNSGSSVQEASSYVANTLDKKGFHQYFQSAANNGGGKANADSLLNFIGGLESGSGGYDALVGHRGPVEGLSNMTLAQVLSMQKNLISQSKNSAAGRYQIKYSTLQSLIKELNLPLSAKFDKATQDKLGKALLDRRGFKDYQSGKINKQQFMTNISKEWASLPDPSTGKSFYGGVGNNRALTSVNAVSSAISGTSAANIAAVSSPSASAVSRGPSIASSNHTNIVNNQTQHFSTLSAATPTMFHATVT